MSLVTVADVTALVDTSLGASDIQVVIDREEQWLARRIGPLAGERTETFYPHRLRERIYLRRSALYQPEDGPTITLSTSAAADDVIDSVGHGLSNADQIEFVTLTGGTGLSVDTTYFVVEASANSFQVALTLGGPAIDFSADISAGTVHTVPVLVTVVDNGETLTLGEETGNYRLVYDNTVVDRVGQSWVGDIVEVTYTPSDLLEVKAAIIDLMRLRATDTGYVSERIGDYSYQKAQTPGAGVMARSAVVANLLPLRPFRTYRIASPSRP